MYRIGIDVGSTFTKYCVMDENEKLELFQEKTPVRQEEYFNLRISDLRSMYGDCEVVACGYGRGNVDSIKQINELTALSAGANYLNYDFNTVLDIGGQDIKYIRHDKGKLRNFFLNDKCAAGSGIFLTNVCNMLEYAFEDIDFTVSCDNHIRLSSTCAVFAQSEIVRLIAENATEQQIVQAVVEQIFYQAKKLINNMETDRILLSGGLAQIKGIDVLATRILEKECSVLEKGNYAAAIGCALAITN